MLSTLLLLISSVAAQSTSSPSVVCVAGQCLQGFSNITIGTKLSAQGSPVSVHLLPGQYTTTTSPQLLHNLLTSASASYSPSAGFQNATSSASLPLDLTLEPGLAIYSQKLYSGQAAFSQLPSNPSKNSSSPLTAASLSISNNIWVALSSGSGANDRIILWDSIPDIDQLPSTLSSKSLSLTDMQSSACSPTCSGLSVCSPISNTCTCPEGFTGSACESCSPGRFGPSCQSCPSGCAQCDDGISGSGRCLKLAPADNAPEKCGCLNGVCASNGGGCTCNAGWTTADDGTACGKCAPGFFLTSTGDCQVCQIGCSQCADTTGTCIACKQGFTQDANDKTKCTAPQSTSSTGAPCPEGSFSDGNGGDCKLCSPSCKTCTGPTSNDCTLCAADGYMFNGNCVGASGDGVCEGSGGFIADNLKHACDTCGAKCTSCKIPNFDAASTMDKLQCTGCLPGFVLSQGKCVESCPAGTFLSPQDNLNCLPCDSSCSTCSGSSDFCLTCTGTNQLSFNGKCVATCPQGTFTNTASSGSPSACTSCHPDCATCSGPSFTQCSACPADRPVLSNGRCLPTCGKGQYFNPSSASCESCDSSCATCSGSGSDSCLSCSQGSKSQVLRTGSCVPANCQHSSAIVLGLGVCLSELVQIPTSTDTNNTAPALPTITGIDNPTIPDKQRPHLLQWWQILLMALGCAFVILVCILCWRRRARKERAKRTAKFASAKRLDGKGDWRGRFMRFGERLFGYGSAGQRKGRTDTVLPVYDRDSKEIKMQQWRKDVEDARSAGPEREHDHELDELDKFLSAYDYSNSESSRHSTTPSSLPSLSLRQPASKIRRKPAPDASVLSRSNSRLSAHSMYSEVTKNPRRVPEPRQPVRTNLGPVRFAESATVTTTATSSSPSPSLSSSLSSPLSRTPTGGLRSRGESADRAKTSVVEVDLVPRLTDAEAYASSVWPVLIASSSPPAPPTSNPALKPNITGGSSRNPFRQS